MTNSLQPAYEALLRDIAAARQGDAASYNAILHLSLMPDNPLTAFASAALKSISKPHRDSLTAFCKAASPLPLLSWQLNLIEAIAEGYFASEMQRFDALDISNAFKKD